MERLKYYRDENVSMFMTAGIKRSIPLELSQKLITLAFERAKELEKKGMEASYFQLFTIKSQAYKEVGTKYTITMEQEQPDYVTEHTAIVIGRFDFNGRIYLIEDWNGKTENVTAYDHYMTLLLPEEY